MLALNNEESVALTRLSEYCIQIHHGFSSVGEEEAIKRHLYLT